MQDENTTARRRGRPPGQNNPQNTRVQTSTAFIDIERPPGYTSTAKTHYQRQREEVQYLRQVVHELTLRLESLRVRKYSTSTEEEYQSSHLGLQRAYNENKRLKTELEKALLIKESMEDGIALQNTTNRQS